MSDRLPSFFESFSGQAPFAAFVFGDEVDPPPGLEMPDMDIFPDLGGPEQPVLFPELEGDAVDAAPAPLSQNAAAAASPASPSSLQSSPPATTSSHSSPPDSPSFICPTPSPPPQFQEPYFPPSFKKIADGDNPGNHPILPRIFLLYEKKKFM